MHVAIHLAIHLFFQSGELKDIRYHTSSLCTLFRSRASPQHRDPSFLAACFSPFRQLLGASMSCTNAANSYLNRLYRTMDEDAPTVTLQYGPYMN